MLMVMFSCDSDCAVTAFGKPTGINRFANSGAVTIKMSTSTKHTSTSGAMLISASLLSSKRVSFCVSMLLALQKPHVRGSVLLREVQRPHGLTVRHVPIDAHMDFA